MTATRRRGFKSFRAVFTLSLALAACSTSNGAPDSGMVMTTPDAGQHLDTGSDSSDATSMTQRDVVSIFGDTGMTNPDVGAGDATLDVTMHPDVVSSSDGGHDGTTPKDGGTKDSSSKDTGPMKDAGCVPVTVGTGTTGANTCSAPVTGSCAPGSLATFTPKAPPPTPVQNVCTAAETQAIYSGCLDPMTSSTAACNATDDACYTCIFGSLTGAATENAATWPPIVSGSNMIVSLNFGGCLTLLEPCNTKCAATLESDIECELAACEVNCGTVTTAAEVMAYSACTEKVDGCDPGGCYQYYLNGQSCASQITGPGTACLGHLTDGNFEAGFLAVVPVFCGG